MDKQIQYSKAKSPTHWWSYKQESTVKMYCSNMSVKRHIEALKYIQAIQMQRLAAHRYWITRNNDETIRVVAPALYNEYDIPSNVRKLIDTHNKFRKKQLDLERNTR